MLRPLHTGRAALLLPVCPSGSHLGVDGTLAAHGRYVTMLLRSDWTALFVCVLRVRVKQNVKKLVSLSPASSSVGSGVV